MPDSAFFIQPIGPYATQQVDSSSVPTTAKTQEEFNQTMISTYDDIPADIKQKMLEGLAFWILKDMRESQKRIKQMNRESQHPHR